MKDLVIVGSVALDDVETPAGKVVNALGGSATYASMVAGLFCRPGVVGVIGSDFPEDHLRMLQERGVDTAGIVEKVGETFHWAGIYEDWNRAITLDTRLNVFAEFDPEIPHTWREGGMVFLGNIDPPLQGKVLDQVTKPRLTACDTMNFWISGKRDELLKVIARIDILFVNEEEIRQLTGIHNVFRAMKAALELGPRWLVVKRGEYGAILYGKDTLFFTPVYPVESVVDPTGAGDCFAGGFMGCLAALDRTDSDALREAMLYGTVAASFDIEDFSVGRLRSLTRVEFDKRLALLKGCLAVPDQCGSL